MANTISKTCFKCGGSKIMKGSSSDPCPMCQGSGLLPVYSVDLSDLMKMLNKVDKKCDEILESLEPSPKKAKK